MYFGTNIQQTHTKYISNRFGVEKCVFTVTNIGTQTFKLFNFTFKRTQTSIVTYEIFINYSPFLAIPKIVGK